MQAFAGILLQMDARDANFLFYAVWHIQPDQGIRNDIHIDHAIVDSDLGRKYQWQVNELGWVETKQDRVVLPGDEALVNIWTYRHLKCHRKHQEEVEREYFRKIFSEAGYKNVRMIQVRNRYCQCTHCAPWYNVVADDLFFLIGWRKRVICIQAENPPVNFVELFPDEDVTKGIEQTQKGEELYGGQITQTTYIHAWGRDKCIEYLREIKKHCRA